MAGEIGHIPLVPGGRQCRCGQQGCLETYLYLPDVIQRYKEETGAAGVDSDEFFTKVVAGDTVARKLMEEAAAALATTISFAEVLLDLEMIVIGGVWGSLGEPFLGIVKEKLQVFLERGGLTKSVIVKGSELGEDSDLLGAVGLVINEWFTPPI